MRLETLRFGLAATALVIALGCTAQAAAPAAQDAPADDHPMDKADVVYHNGTVYTVLMGKTVYEANG